MAANVDIDNIAGPDIHFIAASVKNGKDFSWVCTHKVSLVFLKL
jgi:hypothetical protein